MLSSMTRRTSPMSTQWQTRGGTGLGLAIVKHAAAYHGAQIALESQVDKGTTITVSFPRA